MEMTTLRHRLAFGDSGIPGALLGEAEEFLIEVGMRLARFHKRQAAVAVASSKQAPGGFGGESGGGRGRVSSETKKQPSLLFRHCTGLTASMTASAANLPEGTAEDTKGHAFCDQQLQRLDHV